MLIAYQRSRCRSPADRHGADEWPDRWWSYTETVLSIATLSLAEQGMLELNFPVADRGYTARQLFRHEASLPDYGTIPHRSTSRRFATVHERRSVNADLPPKADERLSTKADVLIAGRAASHSLRYARPTSSM
jgi:hypothetical protein